MSTYTTETVTREAFTYTAYHFTLEVRLAGQTRPVNFVWREFPDANPNRPRRANSDRIFAARIGAGAKVHRADMDAWKFDTVADARAKGYRPEQIFTLDNGDVWATQITTVLRNRQARIVDWADKFEGTQTATQQDYYGSI